MFIWLTTDGERFLQNMDTVESVYPEGTGSKLMSREENLSSFEVQESPEQIARLLGISK